MEEKLSKRERRKATDKAILEAAISEFAEKGYARTRVGDIARIAGVSQGLVSQNFGNKERLFMAATAAVDESLISPEGVEKKLPDIMYNALEWWKKLYYERPSYFKLMYMMTHSIDRPEIIELGLQARFRLSTLYEATVAAQANGELPEGDALEILKDFSRAAINIIYYFQKAGLTPPENEIFLKLIRYTPKKSRKRRATSKK